MQITADPYPAGATSRASDLSGELARIRYVLAQITGETYWYIDPTTSLKVFKTDTIAEKTSAAGVTVDGCLIKDGKAATATTATSATSLAMTGEASSEGSGTITSSVTQLTTVDVGTVTSGDRIWASAWVSGTKGAVDGYTNIFIDKLSGTATVSFHHNTVNFADQRGIGALLAEYFNPKGVIKVTGSGTLVLRLAGTSSGSDTVVSAGNAELYVFFLKKQ